jgi:formamidopyrimidine-DNA glycosylase
MVAMPELPEVEALARHLSEKCRGRRIDRLHLLSIAALKTYEPPLDAMAGLCVDGWTRRGKFLALRASPLFLVLHLARAGWVTWKAQIALTPGRLGKTPVALRLRFSDGTGIEVTERGTEKRLAIHIVGALDQVEGVARLGVDPLSNEFTPDRLAQLLEGRSAHVKGVLVDQRLIAGIGNAYSDEALHVAQLSPFRLASSLGDEEVSRLHKAVVSVLADALQRSKGVGAAGLKSEKRSGFRVHARAGLPCPVCGDTVREVVFATSALQYCPTCQTNGRQLADRRLSRLLK